jgi:peptide deformylase
MTKPSKGARSLRIVKAGSSVLRKTAVEVPLKTLPSPKMKKLFREMAAAIASRDDAVAIAAPQLGHSLRAFMVSGKIFDGMELPGKDPNYTSRNFIFVNPKIVKTSRRKHVLEEGCLSVDEHYGMVKRSEKATIQAYDEKGKVFEWGGSGLLAQIFEHEIDHLNGILFTDKATDLHPPPSRAM